LVFSEIKWTHNIPLKIICHDNMCESFSFCLSGAPRVATAIVKLPLKLIVKPVLPVKTAEYKLTLDTNKPPANLNEIFPGNGYFNQN